MIGAAFRRLARAIGIILIFSVVGPLTFAALVLLVVVGFGIPLPDLLAVGHGTTFATASVAGWLIAFATVLASIPPSIVAGTMFALIAVYVGTNVLWAAWIAVAVAIIGVIALGAFVMPHESSAVILPKIQSARHALASFFVLASLAILPTTLCWWLAKPLSRAIVSA